MIKRRSKPEVLAPAGNLRGLMTAVDYGADAVYCGGKAFGMRSAPRNLSIVSVALGLGYGIGANPAILAGSPQMVSLIFGGSGIVAAAAVAIVLNVVLPKDKAIPSKTDANA